jgi:CheY-like chemotaxis protein
VSRTVLIVDDEPQILALVRKMVGPSGAKILSAPRPSEALRICEGEPVHVLISDVQMPEMDGVHLADAVRKLHPEVSVLLISGHKEPAGAKSSRTRFLKKPFFPSDLVLALREMLVD